MWSDVVTTSWLTVIILLLSTSTHITLISVSHVRPRLLLLLHENSVLIFTRSSHADHQGGAPLCHCLHSEWRVPKKKDILVALLVVRIEVQPRHCDPLWVWSCHVGALNRKRRKKRTDWDRRRPQILVPVSKLTSTQRVRHTARQGGWEMRQGSVFCTK